MGGILKSEQLIKQLNMAILIINSCMFFGFCNVDLIWHLNWNWKQLKTKLGVSFNFKLYKDYKDFQVCVYRHQWIVAHVKSCQQSVICQPKKLTKRYPKSLRGKSPTYSYTQYE